MERGGLKRSLVLAIGTLVLALGVSFAGLTSRPAHAQWGYAPGYRHYGNDGDVYVDEHGRRHYRYRQPYGYGYGYGYGPPNGYAYGYPGYGYPGYGYPGYGHPGYGHGQGPWAYGPNQPYYRHHSHHHDRDRDIDEH